MSDGVEVNETGASPPPRPERELALPEPDFADGGALGRDLADGAVLLAGAATTADDDAGGSAAAGGPETIVAEADADADPLAPMIADAAAEAVPVAVADGGAAGLGLAAGDLAAPGAIPTPVREAAAGGAAAMGFFVDTEDTGDASAA